MITTIETKGAMETQGFYQSGSGPEEILILGSCRTIAFLGYLVRWNDTIGANRFTIRRIDPCEWLEVGIEPRLERAETDEKTLAAIRNCKIFIHEYLCHYGMFNTDRDAPKNIYQFGMACDQNKFLWDISIPNWNDHMILKEDYAAYGVPLPSDWLAIGEAQVEKFCALCQLTSFPEFGDMFREYWRKRRFFYRPNHTSREFTMLIWTLMNDKFLHLETPINFLATIAEDDLFRDPHTAVTDEDRAGYRLEW